MKIQLLLFSLFLAVSSVSLSQTQLSEIEYYLERDDYPKKGFMSVGEDEYFIEQGIEGTKVYLVEEDRLTLKHNLRFRPTDSTLNRFAYSNENSNSGLIYENELLFEIYWDYIYVVNILSGTLHEVIDLKKNGIKLQRNVVLGENFLYFTPLEFEPGFDVRYDRKTKTFNKILQGGTRIGTSIYRISVSNDSLICYDLSLDIELELSHRFSNISFISDYYINEQVYVLVKDENGQYLLLNNEIVSEINCYIPDSLSILTINDDKIICANIQSQRVSILSYDVTNCEIAELVELYNPNGAAFVNYDIRELGGKHLLFGFSNDWQGIGDYYLMNLETGNYECLDLGIDLFSSNRYVKYGDKLFIVAIDNIHYLGGRADVFEVDLKYLTAKRVSRFEFLDITKVIIGEAQSDGELHIYYRTTKPALYKLNTNNRDLREIHGFDFTKNHGIHYSISASLWHKGTYLFATSGSVFMLEGDQVSELDLGGGTYYTSKFLSKGDFVYILLSTDTSQYALKLNAIDLNFSKVLIPDVGNLVNRVGNTENAIINLDGTINAGYYDIQDEVYYLFSDFGIENTSGESVSGNNVLFKNYSSAGGVWFIHNTVTKKNTNIELTPNSYHNIYPDEKGGFYFHEKSLSDTVSIYHINEQGLRSKTIGNIPRLSYYGGNKSDGEVKSLAFSGEKEMVFFSVKGNEHRIKSISVDSLTYYQSFGYNWYESDKRSFLDIKNIGVYDTYTFEFDTEPLLIREGTDERFIFVMEEEDHATLAYKNKDNIISFYKYYYLTKEFVFQTSFQSTRNSSHEDKVTLLRGSEFLLLLNDGIHGLEPWIYNTKDVSLDLVEDLNRSFVSSRPSDSFVGPDDRFYFTALTKEGDRQLFVLDETLAVDGPEKEVLEELVIYPSPSIGEITLTQNSALLEVYDLQGRLCHLVEGYRKLDVIDLSHLSSNIYIIRALTNKGDTYYGQFIISKD